jgi:hypothetical protein
MIVVSPIEVLGLCLIVALATLVWRKVRRIAPSCIVPYGVYVGSYTLTTVIGATILSLPSGIAFLEFFNASIATSFLTVEDPIVFWSMIYGPLLIPGFCIILIQSWFARFDRPHSDGHGRVPTISFGLFAVMAVGLVGYCFVTFWRADLLVIPTLVSSGTLDFRAMMLLREAVFSSLDRVSLGLIYVGLPTLCFVSIHQAAASRQWCWYLSMGLISSATLGLQLMTVQKAVPVVFLISIVLAMYSLRMIRRRTLLGGMLGSLFVLTGLQLFFDDRWTVGDSLVLVTYRMAVGSIATLKIFPEISNFEGIDFMLDIIGIGKSSQASIIVFQYLYPGVQGLQGNCPAPAHIAAYAEAGIMYGLGILAVIGGMIRLVGGLIPGGDFRQASAVKFALFMVGVILSYYATQTAVRDILVSSYGIIWALFVLTPLSLMTPR